MNKIKYISRTGIFLIVVTAGIYFSLNGFNFTAEKNSVQPAHNEEKYSEVRIYAVNQQDFEKMQRAGLEIDHSVGKPGQYLDAWLSGREMAMLQTSGVSYQTLIDDWDTYYNNRQNLMTPAELDNAMREAKERDNVTHSIYGTLNNGCLRDTEVVMKLDSLHAEYPGFVSQKFSIGTTYLGKVLWAVRITKNPNAPTGRPEVMYHALIHAREPASMENQLYYVYWLLENYNTDPIARYILNNREIYWIPVYNRDGYVYNEPGGGMWRKSRKPCSGGIGTDLNRNYGIYQFWNYPNGGSSTSCASDTYRGTLPFSESETLALFNFVNSRNIKSALGAHTYGNYLIRPWAYSDSPTPDENIFLEYSQDITSVNLYKHGRPMQTVGYQTRGGADDWYYNDSGHAKMFQMTPETGTQSDGFWPIQARILPLCEGMLFANQYMSLIAGAYVYPMSKKFSQLNYIPGQSGTYKVKFRNKGLTVANNVKVQLIPWNSYVTIPTQQFNFSSVPVFSLDSCTFNFTLAANAPVNCGIPATLNLKIDTATVYTESIYIYVGSGAVTLNDNAESGTGNWTISSGWTNPTTSYHSPTHSFAAPNVNNANATLTLTNPINAQSAPVCYMTFWNSYSTEDGWDWGLVEVSSNNGATWQQIASYTGANLTWTEQSFDITKYVNASNQLKIRFRYVTDGNTLGSGWWIDDIKLTNYCMATVGVPGNTEIPKTFAIDQNYPNPFNPATVIKYQLPKQELVSIKVFDLLGREVAALVNEQKEPGYHEVVFDGSNLASGLYFYKIEAGNFVESKKMMLIK